MRNNRAVSIITIFLFSFTLFAGSYSILFSQTKSQDEKVAEKLKKAEEYYQNGSFKKAIEIYEEIIKELNQKKELVKAKQKLFQIMASLAFTHFTIQENEKARYHLEKLIKLNPNQQLDEEFYPPKFINMFKELQGKLLGSLNITSDPENAEIYLDSDQVGKTPLKIEKCLVGEHQLKAALKGYETVEKKITINAGEETGEDIVLNKQVKKKVVKKKEKKPEEKKKVVAKEAEKPKKKKKISPVLIAVGAAAITAVVILLLTKKKKEPEPILKSLVFSNTDPQDIRIVGGGFSLLEVFGIPERAPIERVEYRVVIEHPAMQELVISLFGIDWTSQRNIWINQESPDEVTTIEGATTAFNDLPPNGTWKVVVRNEGDKRGQIVEWHLRIFYFE